MAQITLRDYLQRAEDAIRDDRIDDAFTHCRNILSQFPESLEAQRLLGEAYLAQGQLEEAQQSFDWILTNDPENVVAYCNRALICERSLDYDTALDCYQQAYELSHGNSHIRQEFNRLSTETGPQGFMFSRAGLARLYMRGDLLTQAIQEWETVLALNPERLDARTGLLETCWRDAHYDRVEQQATQILQDVPGCLKALFLLAYVSSAKNIEQARELLKRAEALDPDLLMAQELFSDIMARQPAEPFLQLLKKAPVTLETSLPQSSATLVPNQQEAIAQLSSNPPMSMSSETLAAWNGMGSMGSNENWGNDVTLIKDPQKKQQTQEPSPLPVWSAEANPALDIWSVLEQQNPQGVGSQQELQNVSPQLQASTGDINPLNYQPASSQQQEQPLETWLPEPSASQASENNQQEAEFPLWDGSRQYDDFKEPALNGNIDATWPNTTGFSGDSGIWPNPASSSGDSGIWSNSPKENAMPSPPAWLNMLTQSEIRQLNDEEVPKPSPAAEPVASTPPAQPLRNAAPEVIPEPTNDGEEAFSFGPEWLKSLGAASMDDEASPAEAASVSPSAVPAPVVSQPLPAAPRYESQPVAYEAPEEKPQAQPFYQNGADPTGTVEQNLLTTLENLEADLFSQGFVPLEPNTLQTIAKTQEPVSPAVPLTPEVAIPQEEAHQYDALPSLLSQLESFVQEPVNASSVASSSFASAQMTSDAAFEEPSWLASLNAVPTPSSFTERQQEMQTRQEEQMYASLPPVQSSWDSAYTPPLSSVQEEVPQTPAVHFAQTAQPTPGMPAAWSQEKEPVRGEDVLDNTISLAAQPAWSQMNRPQEVFAAQTPTNSVRQGMEAPSARQSSHDYLLNNELETTMKRPAVRLEPMEQVHDFTQNNRASLPPRARMAEQSYAGRNTESNLSYQERLLKGYQHQLVGDYDEAMQEYRIIIRNSPELLGEVVSNVRALLKLAPKYSTGYRVLGDAYMRQGEYLQAMEAYNKALTMAKRAKS
ncbi:MAG TPA: tetratricopeptide repeat protein [Ktedonobacteraceae bacterium]